MIRVGVLSPVFCTGGVERWLIALAKNLPEQVCIVGMGLSPGAPTDRDSVRELSHFVPIFGTKRFSDIGRDSSEFVYRFDTYAEVCDRVCDCDILLVWGDTTVPEWYTGIVVAVAHGAVDWSRRQMEKYDGPRTRYVAVSREALKAIPLGRRKDAVVIHNGVELDRLCPRATQRELKLQHGVRPKTTVVGYIGRFSEEKDPTAAARAVKELNAHRRNSVAMYCGTGMDGGETERKVTELLGKRVIWKEPKDVADALAMADVLVCASPVEGFGLVRVEAMTRGVPLVCTNTGIIPEIVERYGKVCSLIRDPQNTAELAWAVLDAISDFKMTITAASACHENFTARRMADRWASYFEGVMNEEHRPETVDDRPPLSVRGTE
jgi:glycosyltransferase involved in cell wall biosynthesis